MDRKEKMNELMKELHTKEGSLDDLGFATLALQGIDLGAAVRKKFNEVSLRVGSKRAL